MDLRGGTYSSKKDNFNLSDSLKAGIPKFISGGSYTSDPTAYLITGYDANKTGDMYEVTSTTMGVFNESQGKSNNSLGLILGIGSLIIVSIICFINRDKIFEFLSNLRNH